MKKVRWCFSLKGGLKIVEPNKEVAFAYLEEAEKTLSKIKELIEEEDFVWASVRIYYCAYYALYSFLQRIGIKSENHDCSIELVRELLGEKFIRDIEQFKEERVRAQYYLKTGQKENLLKLYPAVKNFYLFFKEIVKNLSDSEAEEHLKKVREMNE